MTDITVDQANQKATVTYTFNGNKAVGTHTAVLKLTAADCQGWDDTSAAGGASATVTLTAENSQEATNDASVTTTANVTTEYATFAQALAAANATSGATLTLLRNVDLGTITATNNITKAMTIDLNGKELRAAVNATSVGILTITKAVAVTIKDSKTGGKIINEVARNSEVRTIFVNKAGATLTLESGTIAVNNTKQFRYGITDHTDGEANVVSCAARAIHQIAGSTVNINGGKVQSKASRNGYGIFQASSASTQRAGTTVLNISGGEIYSECSNRAYGVAAYGKVNLSGGTITAKLNTETVNANTVYVAYKPDDDSYVVHNYVYALQMNGGASVTAASNYYGVLNMTGGEVVAINENVHTTATRNLYIYGIFFNAGSVNVKTGTASDGTYSQKWAAVGDISGGSVRVENTGTLAYGVYVAGEYNSHDDSHTVTKIKNFKVDVTAYQSAYGVYANASVGTTSNNASPNMGAEYAGDVELTNTTVNATTTDGTTAYALMVVSTYGTVFKNATMTKATDAGYTQVYDGEFASAAKMTVNSGTYTAETKKSSSAYAAASSTRSRTIFASTTSTNASRELGGHKEAYAELNIHGGTFTATTSTTEARAVSVGGHTTIDGGHFYANAGSSTARGIYCVSGTLKVSGVDVHSEANSSAFGISLSGGISDNTGFSYSADAELNNLTVDVKTRTGNEADGVLMEVTKKNLPTIPTSGEYMNMYQKGEYAIAPKAIINGGTYTVTSQGTSAYGVSLNSAPLCEDINGDGILAIGEGDLTIKNAEFTVKTKTGNAAYGVWAGGKTSVENTKFTITSATSDAYGLRAYYGKSTIKNSTFDVTATTATAVGLRAEARMSTVNSSNSHHTTNFSGVEGYDLIGEIESEGNTVTVRADDGNTAYGLQVISAKGTGTKTTAAAGLAFKGDHACAGKAIVNGGKYTATASGTTAYAVIVSAPAMQGEATATPTCIINDGKFKGSATSTYADVNENGVAGYCVLNGGFYAVNTNLAKYIPEGLEEVPLASDRTEYGEGYRYEVDKAGMHGIDVCKIGNTKYKTLEEALQVVKSGETIIMIANYTMATPGDYVLPAGATLLVPYSGQTAAKTTSLERKYAYTKPTANLKLSFGSGVNLDVLGTIEAGSQQAGSGQTGGYNGAPHLSYGWIYLAEGSTMTLENGAKLFAWGYVTGTGEIDAKRGSTVYEMFQLTDWRGGTAISGMEGNSQKVMPVNQYYIQNVECPIKFRPGAVELCEGSCNMSSSVYPVKGKNTSTSIQFVGISGSGSLFMMDDEDVSNDTWVRKRYDAVNDKQVYEINSSAKIGGIDITCANLPIIGSKTLSSTKYIMPITNNMKIHLLSGSMYITQNLELAAGAEIEVDKEATAYVNSGVSLYVFDTDEWDAFSGTTKTYPVRYTPSWTTCPRSSSNVPDAAINIHGKFVVNGNLYTTSSGANIFSTNEDAGTVTYNSNVSTSSATVYVCNNTIQTYNAKTCYPAWLQNGEGITPAYSETAGTAAGKTWSYYDDKWQCWTQSGCFTYDAQNNPYIKPAAYVQVTSNQPDANKLHHDAETGSRNFVWDENCYWWEVVSEPTAEGYYRSINADHNGKYNYYYYDSAAACWKIKKITVTWNINGSTTDYSVGYGTKPEWLGATPTKTSTSSNYVWRWDGWTQGSSTEVLANDDLPYVTENTTFTAHFYEKYYEYNITFKNSDGTILDSRNWIAGTTPSYEGTPTKNATVDYTYEFNGSWSPAITTVTGSATYVAQYDATSRAYTITFLNYDMSKLGTAEVNYNGTPTNETYKAAIAPSDFEPYKPDNNAYSFEFTGWRLQGASENGFAQVKGNQTYVAQFAETTKKYRITFLDDDGETVLHWTQLEFDAEPSYDGPDMSAFASGKQTTEWNYIFSGWNPAEFTQVKGPQTYTAVYNKTKREYDITWVDGNGNPLKTDQVAYGSTPAYTGTTPTKTATAQYTYTFNNTWSPAIVAVTGEATYTAQFGSTVNEYTITWVDGNGETLKTEQVAYGTTPAYTGTTPTKTATAQYTYTFNNTWSPAIVAVEGDASYTAQFGSTVNKYDITWRGEGITERTDQVEYGTTPEYGELPTKESTTQQVFTYKWMNVDNAEVGVKPVTGNATYEGSFTGSPRPYTITFVNDNGDVLQSSTIGYGSPTPAYVGTPVSKLNAECDFIGWSPEMIASVGGEATYTATYRCTVDPIVVEANATEPVTVNTATTTTTVHVSGTLTVAEDVTLTTDDLILEATPSSSGEISGKGDVKATNVYFHLSREGGFQPRTWYAVAVPWQVDVPAYDKANSGVYIKTVGGNFVQQVLGRSYDLIYYNGALRATGASKAWNYVEKDDASEHVMVPGRAYMIYLTSYADTIRFKKNSDADLFTKELEVYEYYSDNGDYENWNGIANPATYKAYLNVDAAEGKGQVYNPDTKGYEWFEMTDPLQVGQPIFVQPKAATTVVANNTANSSSQAPRRVKEHKLFSRYELMLAPSDENVSDRIIVRMDEDKETDAYVVGEDLAKMGVSSVVAQMWIDRYDTKMSINTVAPLNNTADYPLGLYAPKRGEYDLFIDVQPDSETMLYLTYDGEAVWNLSYGGYVLNLDKGTNTHYGLRIVYSAPKITTGIEEATIQNGEAIRKVIVDDKVYIIRNGEIYSVTGQKAK